MIDPYHMVFINAALSILVLLGWSFYTFVYPKKKCNLLFLLIIISLLPTVSIFRLGSYESGDFTLHLYRAIDFYASLKEAIIMPSWAGLLNAHYGYPLFLFLNPLPYYIIGLFHFLGLSFVMSMKFFLAISYILSGIFMYLFTKLIFKKSFPAFASSVFYLFAPYHLIDLHFRVDVGEVAIFMILPLILYSYQLLVRKQNLSGSLFLSFSIFLAVLAHQAMAFFSIILLISYILFTLVKKNFSKKLCVYTFFAVILGLVLSAYMLLPYLIYIKFLHTFNVYGIIFTTSSDLFFTPWRSGFLFQGPRGEIGSLVGYTQLVLIPLALFQIYKNKKLRLDKETAYWIFVTLVCFGLLFPPSKIIWNTIPLIHLAVLSTRLLLFITLGLAMIAGIIALKTSKKFVSLYTIFIIITIAYTILNWGNRRTIPAIGDAELINNMPFSTSQIEGWPEAIPLWKNPRIFEKTLPAKDVQIERGRGVIRTVEHFSTKHEYIVDAKTPLTITDYTWYFPGWSAFVDNKQTSIVYRNKQYTDTMSVKISPGLHILRFSYQDLAPVKIAKTITIILLSLIILYFFFLTFSLMRSRKYVSQ